MDEQYPAIAKRAKKEKAEIYWGDETGLCNDSRHGRSYAPRGQTPAIRLPAKRERINLISSITNQGKVRFMLYCNNMNAKTLIKFLTRLAKNVDLKVFLILDNLRVHHSKIVKQWLREHLVTERQVPSNSLSSMVWQSSQYLNYPTNSCEEPKKEKRR